MKHRILVADGHWLIRCGLRATLEQSAEHEVVAEASNTQDAVAQTLQLVPDIALIDIRLPGAGGVAAMRSIKEERRSQKVLLLGDQGAEASVRDALRAGCDGFVRKDSSDHELIEALNCVRGGKVYLSAEVSREMVLFDYQCAVPAPTSPLERLSARELDVFRLIGAGHTNRAAGERMRLSPKTVEKYRATVMRKLSLSNAVELRLLALDLGIAERPAAAGRPPAGGD